MTSSILVSQDLVCGYRHDRPLTPALNLTIQKNDIVAILGVNGQGKSTLLNTLLGTIKPLSGHVLTDYSLSFVPQHFNSTYDYTVLEIVLMGCANRLGLFNKPTSNDVAFAKQNLILLGLENSIDKPFSQLSGGQKQLVLIARALTAKCQLLLLDEPTSALDLHNQKRVLHILHNLVKERDLTIMFSTHDPAQAITIATTVLLLERDHYMFGPAERLLTEANLSRLYQIAMKKVNVANTHTIIPLYWAP